MNINTFIKPYANKNIFFKSDIDKVDLIIKYYN